MLRMASLDDTGEATTDLDDAGAYPLIHQRPAGVSSKWNLV